MSHTLPIIVSDTGATAELVDHSNGYLIEKNSVPELKKAILSFYNLSHDEKRSLGQRSYQKVCARFTWKQVATDHMELFKSFEL